MVNRVVKPKKLILSRAEFMAMDQREVEKWYEEHDQGEPRYWHNVADLSQRMLRQHIHNLQAWLCGLACLLMFCFTLNMLFIFNFI